MIFGDLVLCLAGMGNREDKVGTKRLHERNYFFGVDKGWMDERLEGW